MDTKHTPGPRLSGPQLFVLREMQRATSIAWLDGHYAQTRYALQRKGLIEFNDARGTYVLTPAGKAAQGGTK